MTTSIYQSWVLRSYFDYYFLNISCYLVVLRYFSGHFCYCSSQFSFFYMSITCVIFPMFSFDSSTSSLLYFTFASFVLILYLYSKEGSLRSHLFRFVKYRRIIFSSPNCFTSWTLLLDIKPNSGICYFHCAY